MNKWLMELGLINSLKLYSLFNIAALVVAFAFLLYLKSKKIVDKDFFSVVLSFGLIYGIIQGLHYSDYYFFKRTDLILAYRGFLITFLLQEVLMKKDEARKSFVQNFTFMTYLLFRSISSVACIISGCCSGRECIWGLYSRVQDKVVFPVMAIECILTLLLFCGVAFLAIKKRNRNTQWPVIFGAFLYGVITFVMDLFRDNSKVIGMTSLDGIVAFCMIILVLSKLYSSQRVKKIVEM